jgi:hypothetical protein
MPTTRKSLEQAGRRAHVHVHCDLKALEETGPLVTQVATWPPWLLLVLAWHISCALGETRDALQDLVKSLLEARGHSASTQCLIAAANYAGALALAVGEASEDESMRTLCFSLAHHCSADAARIRRQLLWTTDQAQ